MAKPNSFTDAEILQAYAQAGNNATAAARQIGINVRNIHARLAKIEGDRGATVRDGKSTRVHLLRDTKPNPITMENGVIMVASDCHYWPGEKTAAHRAFVKIAKLLKPDIVIINGDEIDLAKVSRHGPIGWETAPDPWEEIEVVKDRLGEIKKATPGAIHLATYGNHTSRYDTFLATHAAQLRGVFGTRLEDHFPGWDYRWAYLVNGHTLIKHRIRAGIHGTWNSTMDTHLSTVTGHCHSLQVRPRTTMSPLNNGTIYGVDTGMLADPWGPQFHYAEFGPRNWRAGFAVLTFNNSILMPPETAQVVGEDMIFFRGNTIKV